jgi:ketosteroid isomerase-like protein
MKALILGLALVTAAAPAVAATPEEEIRQVLEAQTLAWNRGDLDGFLEGYANTPDTTFVSGVDLERGFAAMRGRYRERYASREAMGTLDFTDLDVRVLCADAAVVSGAWELDRKADHPHGRFTLIFRRTPAGWKIVYDHTS